MPDQDVISKMKDLINEVNFSDKSYDVAVSMCEIIVKGKPVDYMFNPDPELPGYWAEKGEYLENFWFDELTKSLLERSNLIEIDEQKGGVSIRPTEKALKLYEEFREEDKINEDGYLD